MTTERNDEIKSWGISVFIHGLLLFITMFWVVASKSTKAPEIIELAFAEPATLSEMTPRSVAHTTPMHASASTAATQPVAREARAQQPRAPQQSAKQSQTGASTIPVPPRQQRGMEEEPMPEFGAGRTSIASAPDRGLSSPGRKDERETDLPSTGTRDGSYGVEGDQNSPITTDPGQLSGTPATVSNIDWGTGPARNRIAGSMPAFPSGVNRDAKIKVRFTVKPDGSVRGITFLQKGEPAFENAVLRAMRTWKFNKLPETINQTDQNGIATFNFQLR